ncbi:uncharacterized protein A4U43_C09F5490 [Asparagus officinalis]|uniref:Uncharacterized protein n=1 Tax=Asparagus officinalis TaxID=4686 RepID=A0A5P1EAC2_ASPOF|nr:uncharacterized protein A4U43_C09F5490 [Asparagus officinalis]
MEVSGGWDVARNWQLGWNLVRAWAEGRLGGGEGLGDGGHWLAARVEEDEWWLDEEGGGVGVELVDSDLGVELRGDEFRRSTFAGDGRAERWLGSH